MDKRWGPKCEEEPATRSAEPCLVSRVDALEERCWELLKWAHELQERLYRIDGGVQ